MFGILFLNNLKCSYLERDLKALIGTVTVVLVKEATDSTDYVEYFCCGLAKLLFNE